MNSRRDFFRKSALLAGAAALPTSQTLADDPVKTVATTTGDLPFKNTYVKNLFVTENEYRNKSAEITKSPGYQAARELLPVPKWEGNQLAIDMYWKTWEIAFRNIKDPEEKSGFISSYLDTAYNGNIFMWDSNFITMFARYGSRVYPFQKTLDNFYAKQHPDGFICREIWGDTGMDCFERFDPTSTGPNLIPWSEIEYFKHFADWERIHKVFPVLCGYYQWLKLNRTWKDGSYWSSGWGTGMDNQPRVLRDYNPIFSHGHMTWLDTCLQQLFIGKTLVDLGFYVERWQEIEGIEDETKSLKKYIKENLWDPKSNFLYDKYADGSLGTLKGIGAFWTLWTDVLDADELESFVAHLKNENTFYRKHPIPSIPADHEKYQPDGRYWQGGVWAPTNYMIISGLKNKGFRDLAFDLAIKHHQQVATVFKNTGTFWEYYAPESTEPGLLARPDFIGWTGLVPVSILFELIFGIQANALKNTLDWDVQLTDEHGIDRYPIGEEGLLSLKCNSRSSVNQKPSIEINSNIALKFNLKWGNGEETFNLKPGDNKIN
ncbi:MGH1-like glycoside hydrolase domain-containing protein [Sunxiuqinia sp. A32]|uniref:MGH1-like glycoside hydrolase domain-containing protein n=1 Tax=Sunxiuqinia sp. A32 TaxID=3461496 RepID=UPI00404527D3